MKDDQIKEISEEEAKNELDKNMKEAERILNDKDKMDEFLLKLEEKLKTIPLAGNALSMIPTMVSLIKSYIKKEYTDIPVGTITAVISALLYWLSPVDLIPDFIPGFGYVDDAAVVAFCLKLVGDDLEEYRKWRDNK